MPVSSMQLLSKVVFGMFVYSPLNSDSMKSFTELSGTASESLQGPFSVHTARRENNAQRLGPQEGPLSRGRGSWKEASETITDPQRKMPRGGWPACPSAGWLELGYWQYEFTFHRKKKKCLVISEGFRYMKNQNVLIIWKCRWCRNRNHFTQLERKSTRSKLSLNWNTNNQKVKQQTFVWHLHTLTSKSAQCQGNKWLSGIWPKKKCLG